MANTVSSPPGHQDEGETRRDFLLVTTATVGVVGVALAAWPFIHSMNPAADTLAVATTGVDLAPIDPGQRITVMWRGKPVFISHRTEAEIEAARAAPAGDMIDPEPDEARIIEPQWLVVVGVCTHLGCIPLGQRSGDPRGEFQGWFCPCHGSHYDTSGRIRRGPAPTNLPVPPYEFVDDTSIQIG
ncbi:MAG: ubiquinol-cytochrome c reductase iron-sulfur subunit [Rhodospirillales bacterium]|nr:MAG: ubiquinol-cytochrome c reductase iron-sulfur subunit [Rhodospirillales bacterium]